jgi:hypothetical protein
MSKKNRHAWQKNASQSPVAAPGPEAARISPAQLEANHANSQLSTGPRTSAGLAKSLGLAGASTPDSSDEFAGRACAVAGRSKMNALKSGLTGRTVLLPTDDIEEYTAFLEEFQQDLQPVGKMECELVQIVVDCYRRLRRIQELEEAFYARGCEQLEEQIEEKYGDKPPAIRRSMIVLETHLAYQKELRNLHIQEARIDRKRRKALDELKQLQSDRQPANESTSAYDHVSEAEGLALFAAGYIPPSIAENYAKLQQRHRENGFEFSSTALPQTSEASGLG